MKKLLLLPILLLTFIACQDDFDDSILKSEISTLTAGLAETKADLAAAEAMVEASLTAFADGSASTINGVIESTTAALAALAQAQEALKLAVAEGAEDLGDTIVALQTSITALEAELAEVGVAVDALEDRAYTYTEWEPEYLDQTADFIQTKSPILGGVTLSETVSRHVISSVASATLDVATTELAENVDVNSDLDFADDLVYSYVKYIHVGTVSGTIEVVGTHTIEGAQTPFRVSSNN